MDHKVSKDMISSGMIPSGEKTQADLGRTQYGSAPSPSKLMDAYKSMYEHHQKDKDGNTIPHEGEELNEGKIPAGLQAYLDKKKGKKEVKEENINELKSRTMLDYIDKASDSASKQLDKANKTTSRKKEVKARLKMDSRERGIEMAKDKIMKRVTDRKEDADLFDVVSGVFVAEGYEEKDAYKVMSQLTEEQLNEIAVTGTIATLGAGLLKGVLGAGKVAAAAGKGLASAGKAAAVKSMTAAKSAASGLKSVAKTGMTKASDALSKVSNIAKDKAKGMGDTMTDLGKFVGDEVKGEVKRKIVQGNNGGSNKITKTGQLSTGSKIAASADLFDIVKGQLLDEGMSEEDIKDIMLTLTPDEILNELSGDLLKRAAIKAGDERGKLASQGDREGAMKKMDQQKKFSDAMKSKNLEKSRSENMRKPTQYDRPVSRPVPDPTKPYPGTPR